LKHEIVRAPPASHALTLQPPPSVAAAVVEFISWPLAEDPFWVGNSLRNELAGTRSARRGRCRVLYAINARVVTVTVVAIAHRPDVFRTR
jgi:mRNA-degrading endonuclease RelE of RelBE toxin-antitoxin system